MTPENPILIVDDDQDDLMLIGEVVKALAITRPVYYFRNGDELVSFLESSELSPFLILSDVNLPGETGFEIRQRIAEDPVLRYKTVPFIFWSTSASQTQIKDAYDLPAQGFFFKPSSFEDLCETFRLIIGYWQKSQHPKRVS